MSHMQPQITERMLGWKVETTQGTWYVPGDVEPVPYAFKRDHTVARTAPGADAAIFDLFAPKLHQYTEGGDIISIEVIQCYFARLSAPGYLDCTDWTAHYTKKDARDTLRELLT